MNLVISVYQTPDFATAEAEIDLDSCFESFRHDLFLAIKKNLICQMEQSSNDEIAKKLIGAGLYAKSTSITDIRTSITKLRRKMNLAQEP